MSEQIKLGDLTIFMQRKRVKHIYLRVLAPDGRVTLVAPIGIQLVVIHAFAVSKLSWIQKQQTKLQSQVREAPRQLVEHESHTVWGHHYVLQVVEKQAKPCVLLNQQSIILQVRPGSDLSRRAAVMHAWYKSLLHGVVPGLIEQWQDRLGVSVSAYFLQRMKTRWGSCNPRTRHIRLNTDLVTRPKDLLEYIVVHEMVHLLEASHNKRFVALMDQYYPAWREATAELNQLPLAAVRPRG
ncbi:hypothetical protein SAMN05216317_11043 [Nitrosomonas eutropha]|uniref:M48 family metallopeptidase n=1 Tax=Nitrosomonas eutropha TaxID=916 RepID=UPI000894FC29|nr:SprT family zinc-dependent metalloprotease [Nitrosomonas eutropha]SDW68540.1 hypothetical protein SAMN05216317_11043 [Nitrosomonas eutropha]